MHGANLRSRAEINRYANRKFIPLTEPADEGTDDRLYFRMPTSSPQSKPGPSHCPEAA